MEAQLDSLIERLKNEGVDEAQKQSKTILDEANKQASKIIADAKAEKEAMLKQGKEETEKYIREFVDYIKEIENEIP